MGPEHWILVSWLIAIVILSINFSGDIVSFDKTLKGQIKENLLKIIFYFISLLFTIIPLVVLFKI